MYEILRPDFNFRDDRGCLVQLVHNGYTQVNVITTKKGALRGNHYHKQCQEAFYIVTGSVDVTLSKDNRKETVHFQSGDFFVIPPFTVHSMSYPEECIMIALYDKSVELTNGEKDIYPVMTN